MNDTAPRRLPKSRILLMVVIDLVAIALAVGLYLWLGPRDMNAAMIAAVSCLVFGAFFNLVIVLVSLKP
jgi:membrane protein YdbS with pleckstrin-like domain